MNGIVRSAFRATALRGMLSSSCGSNSSGQPARALWNVCGRRQSAEITPLISTPELHDLRAQRCYSTSHTKAEKELVEFLAEEIVAEKKAQKLKMIPTTLNGFSVSLNGAEVNLEKKDGIDNIHISFNVNHTVDADTESEMNPNSDNVDIGEMKSKPNFTVDIVRGNQTLGFSCSFNNQAGASGADDNYNDIFGIDEITLYEGNHNDKVYSVAGEIIDGYLYDLLMNYLEEKGISNEFAEKLIELSTCYEHTAYVSLLEGLSKFTSGK
ncbi:PREDICTED: complement component 1 Q subcomponent-binding protein, mitochondrial [Cyphomyrmex costatus]|uniref:Complement component 1 Q subcomponent-binding protein, mitochondrial n=1 Tax=Cyphomyrmex costatus TaxID=456900 RepID=A0A195C0A3_9HYME|nr:PREDICTED: complement component 1 Q subcomponent-binding protein, mitochondrial [Cyphomyrmex costatus]KYM93578.1 Complement component 1 Q subcomponent-binding protein, mitochondrial [Cyphomyrmex costatus]